jgi:hypothetical protein
LLAGVPSVASSQPDPGFERRLDTVLNYEHGLARLSPEQKAEVAALLAHPDELAAAVAKRMPRWDAAHLANTEDFHRFGRAVSLLGQADAPATQAQLTTWFQQLAASGDSTPNVVLSQRVLLNSFQRRPSPAITGDLVARLDKLDYGTRVAALNYLGRVERGNASVREALTRMTADPRSPLHNDPAALGALRAIRGEHP